MLTPQEDLREGIVLVLGRRGGKAQRSQVLNLLEELIGDALTEEDREPVASRPFEEKWRNRASYERHRWCASVFSSIEATACGSWTTTVGSCSTCSDPEGSCVPREQRRWVQPHGFERPIQSRILSMSSAAATAPVINRPGPPRSEPRIAFAGFSLGSPSYTPTADTAAEAGTVGLEATLLAIDEQANTVSILPVHFGRRVTTMGTATLFGTDDSGAIKVVATVTTDPPSLKLNLRYLAGSSAVPRDLLASFRFLRALRRPNRLGMIVGNRPVGEPDELPVDTEFPHDFLEVVRSLAFVQAMTGVEFALPPDLDDDDLRTLQEAEALLRGETVSNRWSDATLGLSMIDSELLGVVDGGGSFRLEFVAPVVAVIAGHAVPLGDAHYTFRVAVLENYAELVEAAKVDAMSGAHALLRPGDDDRYEVALISPPQIGFDLQDVRPSVVASSDALDAARRGSLRRDAFQTAAS